MRVFHRYHDPNQNFAQCEYFQHEIDGSITKTFRISETLGFNFRAAAFNLLNHPMYKNPGSCLGSFSGGKPSASFGKITGILNTGATGAGAPRRIEFMMRLEF